MNPDNLALTSCISGLAEAMNMSPLPDNQTKELIEHVLFSGKGAWKCYKRNIITEIELRNLVLAHSATRIAHFNRKTEPSSNTYITDEIEACFDSVFHFSNEAEKLFRNYANAP